MEALESRVLLAAVVTTDQADYAPGSTAVFTASTDGGADNNFQVGETVQFQVTRTDGFTDYAPGNLPWLVTDGASGFTPYQNEAGVWTYPDTDNLADGNIGTTWYVDAQYAGAWLQLQATGLTSGEVATVDFTDSAIGTPTSIGKASNATSGSSIGVSLTTGVTVGNTILVAVAMDPSTTTVSLTDTAGNTYTKDADVSNLGGNSTTGVRTLIFSAPVTSALSSGNQITVTFGANVTAKAVSAFSISGLVTSSSPRDRVITGTGNNSSPNSGTTASATSQTHELLFSVIGDEDRTVTFNAGSNYTALTPATIDGGNNSSSITVLPQYRTVSTKTTYSAGGTIDQNARWASALVTYKAALTTVTNVTSSNSTSTYGNSVTFTATVTTQAPATETPTGTVAFYAGTTLLGTGTALSGAGSSATSTFTTSALSAGTHSTINAVYTGTGSFTTSTSSNFSQTVNARAITITATPDSKTYDGTTTATAIPTLTSGTIVAGQTTIYSESFADRNAGTGKKLTPTVVIRDASNTDVTANYAITRQTVDGTITPKALTVSGLTATDRPYDGTTVVSLGGNATFLSAVAVGEGTATDGKPYSIDTISIGGSALGTLADAHVGTAKGVTISGLSVSGSGNGNYTLVQPTDVTASITPRTLSVTLRGVDKVYDGSTAADVILSDDRLVGDVLTTSYVASFADRHVGTDKTVAVSQITLTGDDAGNYLVDPNGSTTASITPRQLNVSAASPVKDYDRTTAAQVTLTDDRVAGDLLALNFASANFDDAEIGSPKTVTVSGITVSGAQSGNYSLAGSTLQTTSGIENLPAVLSAGPTTATYVEDAAPVVIDPTATVADGALHYNNGSLTIAITANGTSEDQLGITYQGKGPGMIALVGSNVMYSNVVIGSFSGGTGLSPLVISFNANATPEAAQALVRTIHFSVTGDTPSTLPRTIQFTLNDGAGAVSVPSTATVAVTPVNDAPQVVSAAGSTVFAEFGDPVVVDAALTIGDVDSADFAGGSLSVSIPRNGSSHDVLSIRHEGTLPGQVGVSGNSVTIGGVEVGTVSGGTGTPLVISFTTAVNAEAAQSIARNIQFSNSTVNISSQARTIRFVLRDGDGGTTAADREVSIAAINQPPVVTGTPTAYNYLENDSPIGISGQLTLSDLDRPGNFGNGVLTVDIVSNASPEDRLGILDEVTGVYQIGLSGNTVLYRGVDIGTFQGGHGSTPLTISLNENATLGATQALLRCITYSSVSDAPSTLDRTVRFVLADGSGATSNAVLNTVAVAVENDSPIVTLSGGSLTYTENDAATPVDAGLSLVDYDNASLAGGSLIVDIPVNGTAKDRLQIRNEGTGAGQIGVTGNDITFGNVVIGTLTDKTGSTAIEVAFNANATPEAAQALARNITFVNLSDAPSTLPRSVKFIVKDGSGGSSLAVVREIQVVGTNDAPVFAGISGTASYTENGAGIAVLSVATISDADLPANFAGGSLTVDLAANGAIDDRLAIRNQGTAAGQIGVSGSDVTYGNVVIGSFTGGTSGTPLAISLNAQATQAATQALVRNIMFSNTGDNPGTLARTARFVLNDGQGGISNAATRQIAMTAVNDASTIVGLDSSVTFLEGSAAILVAGTSQVADADSPDFNGGSLSVSLIAGAVAGDKLTFRTGGGISVAGNVISYLNNQIGTFTGGTSVSPLIVTFNNTGNATLEAVQALLQSIQFQATGSITADSTRTLRFVVKDGDGGTSLGYLETINVINQG